MNTTSTNRPPGTATAPTQTTPIQVITLAVVSIATTVVLLLNRVMVQRPNDTRRALQRKGLRRGGDLDAASDEQGNVITDNLGMIVFGILAIVVIGGLISGLGTRVVNYVSKELGV